jgi:hypothetical protein
LPKFSKRRVVFLVKIFRSLRRISLKPLQKRKFMNIPLADCEKLLRLLLKAYKAIYSQIEPACRQSAQEVGQLGKRMAEPSLVSGSSQPADS